MGGADAAGALQAFSRRKRGGRLTPRSTTLVALGATGLTFATANTAAQPAQAQSAAQPAATTITVSDRRLNVRSGRRVIVRGTAQPSSTVSLRIQRAGRWRTLA